MKEKKMEKVVEENPEEAEEKLIGKKRKSSKDAQELESTVKKDKS